ncbi:ribosomal protein S18 acetylase RimI-like enzyme [Ancylobacter sp. 3268]|uniref:GNAT family N-acetyltransferase n=1 Tax=Ancylobacter sp. 3268 TaxID=2817752 RepID=UPI00285DCBC3|nr:GNAT family N-acetyltransferase [Ancylobacter sp. 3268]MDR6951690.1 ribosomal protein S18 acetylase RimI-like enzyme [Ancylobacter sp. 3268]
MSATNVTVRPAVPADGLEGDQLPPIVNADVAVRPAMPADGLEGDQLPSRVAADVTVRPAIPADLPAVLALYRELDADDELDLSRARAVFDRMARYPDYALYVAEAAGEVVGPADAEAGEVLGTFTLLVMENIAHGGSRSAVIEAVAVGAAAQGRGVGRAMMGAALDMARAKGCYKAALSTRMSRERAHAFYESLGFRRHGYSFYTELEEGEEAAGDAMALCNRGSPSPQPSPRRGEGDDGARPLSSGNARSAAACEGASNTEIAS